MAPHRLEGVGRQLGDLLTEVVGTAVVEEDEPPERGSAHLAGEARVAGVEEEAEPVGQPRRWHGLPLTPPDGAEARQHEMVERHTATVVQA